MLLLSSSSSETTRARRRQRRSLPLVQRRGLLPDRQRLRGVPGDGREARAPDRLGVRGSHPVKRRGPELRRAVREEADAAGAGGPLGAGAGAVAGRVEVALVDWGKRGRRSFFFEGGRRE